MSATISGALKAHIETLGLSLVAYRDKAPEGHAAKWVTIQEGISTTTTRHGDMGNGDTTATELVQVDLFQQHYGSDGSLVEIPGLASDLVAGIEGASLTTAPDRVWFCTVDGWLRLIEDEHGENLVHHPITVRVIRDL